MEFHSKYESKQPDQQGYIEYSADENAVWRTLYERQLKLIEHRACDEFPQGLEKLGLSANHIPQLPDVNAAMQQATGWQVHPVQALITPKEFFTLLSNSKFPAATFIRSREDLDYVTEPDIFHELFGHCPMLTEPVYADFVRQYGEMVLTLPEEHWSLLQRLFWFTVEFGLINTSDGLRAYGGGILSSIEETVYSVESDIPERKPFAIVDALRTPYRIDMLQKVYFVINDYQQLYDLVRANHGTMEQAITEARSLGEFAPTFPVDDSPTVHIHAC